MKRKQLFILILIILFPVLLWADQQVLDFKYLVKHTVDLLFWPIQTFIFFVATVSFFWGLISLITGGDTPLDGKKGPSGREKAKQRMIWGIIALVIMFSIWSITKIMDYTFNLDRRPINTYPQFHLN